MMYDVDTVCSLFISHSCYQTLEMRLCTISIFKKSMTKFPLTSPPGQYLPKHIHEQNKQRRFYPQQNQMAPSSWNSHPGQGNVLKGIVIWVVRRGHRSY